MSGFFQARILQQVQHQGNFMQEQSYIGNDYEDPPYRSLIMIYHTTWRHIQKTIILKEILVLSYSACKLASL